MKAYQLSNRKPDILDELNTFRKERGIAYRTGDLIALDKVHQEMKYFWLRNGWSEAEAQEDYLIHIKECEVSFADKFDEITDIKGTLLLLNHR